MTSTFLLLAAHFLAAGVWALPADESPPGPLSLTQCLEIAARSQEDVLAAQNNVTIAGSRLSKAKGGFFPQVTLRNNAFVASDDSAFSKPNTGTGLVVSQNFLDGGLREASVTGARYGVDRNRGALIRTRQTTTFNVTSAYYDLLRSQRLSEVSQENVKYSEALRKQILAQADAGESAPVDVFPVEAQLANARVDLLTAENTTRNSALALQSAMGVWPQSGFAIQEVEGGPSVTRSALKDQVDLALQMRADLAAAKADKGAAAASVKSARISIYPRPVITGTYQKDISGGITSDASQIIGGVVFDVFDGGANQAALREARASEDNARLQITQIERGVRTQVEAAYINLTSAQERLKASTVSLDASTKNFEAQKDRYTQGLATTLDLLNAEVQLVTARSSEVRARYDYYTAVAQLEYAVGSRE
jgi:outer membrane protein TolC